MTARINNWTFSVNVNWILFSMLKNIYVLNEFISAQTAHNLFWWKFPEIRIFVSEMWKIGKSGTNIFFAHYQTLQNFEYLYKFYIFSPKLHAKSLIRSHQNSFKLFVFLSNIWNYKVNMQRFHAKFWKFFTSICNYFSEQ